MKRKKNQIQKRLVTENETLDKGANPYVVNLEKLTKNNPNYRTTVWTGIDLQMTLMSIEVGGDIGLEIHDDGDQFLRIESGEGKVVMGKDKDNLDFESEVEDDYAIFIPQGYYHNIINTGDEPLKLYALYAPPEHPKGRVDVNKPVSEMAASDLSSVERYADSQLDPADVEFTKHFFDRVGDPRNIKPISAAELIGFFKRLAKKKKAFIEFLKQYNQFVVTDKRTDINIPFVRQVNQIIAKTIMRKKGFMTSNPKFTVETIKKVDGKYVVYPKKGGKRLGTHDTLSAAKKQLAAIEISKHEIADIQEVERDYKKEYEEYHSKPKQKKRRAQRNAARRKMEGNGKVRKGDGKDVHHKNGDTSDNSSRNLQVMSKSKNRAIKEEIKIPVEVGDTILTGRFKNKKVVVKQIGKDEHGMPTINGKKIVTFRTTTQTK